MVLFVLATAFANPGGLGSEEPDGYWDDLGEDGRVWVPAERPTTTSLPDADLGAYHNHVETEDVLTQMASQRPDLFSLSPLGTTVQGRTIWLMSVTGPGDASDRARILLDGAHHGDEVIGSESLTRFLIQIHEEYDTDPLLQDILDNVVVDVVPIVNVDGVAHVPECSFYADCRKNANGVDLNRNYPDHWGGSGSSGSPGSAIYRGPEPLSEPETQALSGLLDERDYALHASFHSGAEVILWPYGWTTAPPPEEAVYNELGDELTDITGVSHGQISTALYLASGTTVDQAYGSAAGWRPISYTPEAYRGSGNAFDWWLLFNPPETEEAVQPVVDTWLSFIWHLAEEAPRFAPATLEAPLSLDLGPDAGTLEFTVTEPERRPFVDANAKFMSDGSPIYVDSTNPVPLTPGGNVHEGSFDLFAWDSGSYAPRLVFDAGPAGIFEWVLDAELTQVGVDLDLERDTMGTPHGNEITATIHAGPFEVAAGDVEFMLVPGGEVVDTQPFVAWPGEPVTVESGFTGYGLADGPHRVIATADFTALHEGEQRGGAARLDQEFLVERAQVEATKAFHGEGPAFEPFVVRTDLENTGSREALEVRLTETVPPGYAYVPGTDSVASPPNSVIPRPDGSTDLVWHLGDLAPAQGIAVEYTLLPLLPGESVLESSWAYKGEYDVRTVAYAGEVEPAHRAV